MNRLNTAFADVVQDDVAKFAALDIGSNSFHLVIARVVAGDIQIMQRVKQKVYLADGLNNENILSEEAIERGLSTLSSMAETLVGLTPEQVRVVATHTLRKARNANDFLRRAKKLFPFEIEIISGVEEARLIYAGVANTTQDNGGRLVIDIGGGSTEFALGSGFTPTLCKSVKMGCVSYRQRFFKNGDIKLKNVSKAITSAQQEIELLVVSLRKHTWIESIGTSGTIKAIAAVLSELEEGSQNLVKINYKGLKSLLNACCEFNNESELNFPGLTDDRRPLFLSGLCILIAIFKSFKMDAMQFNSAALREGVMYEMQSQTSTTNIRERTAQSLATRYSVDIQYAQKVLGTANFIFDNVSGPWKIRTKEIRHLMGWASLLHEVGLQVNSRGVQRHSSYIIEQSDLPGFNDEQQRLLGVLVRFHRKKLRVQEIPAFYNYTEDDIIRLLIIIRLSVLLNMNRNESSLPELSIGVEKNNIVLSFPDDWFKMSPLLLADIEQENEYLKSVDYSLRVN